MNFQCISNVDGEFFQHSFFFANSNFGEFSQDNFCLAWPLFLRDFLHSLSL